MRLLLCLLLPLSGDHFAAGLRAYREGRFQDALAAFAAAEREAGDGAPAELLYDKALAALRAGSLSEAEAAADRAAARGGAEFALRRDLLRGNLAFARGEAAGKQAGSVESEPFAFDAAIALVAGARDAFASVVIARPDWPHARRNAERAVRLLDDLQQRKAAAEAKKKKEEKPAPPPPPADDKPPDAKPAADELSPEQVRRLFDKLAVKEKEKVRLRRSQQQAGAVEVQKDW